MDSQNEKTPSSEETAGDDVVSSRRGMMALVGAAMAYTSLGANKAAADASVTVNGGSNSQYGILSSAGVGSPPILPTLGTTTHGVIGSASSLATATVDSGVFGARSGSGRAGVLGVNGGDGFGVMGVSVNAIGIFGDSPSKIGVYGRSASGTGLRGDSTSSYGVLAQTSSDTLPALFALSKAGSPFAALFRGRVRVTGDFSVSGAKAAAVPLPDGSMVTMYSQESPEPWFEDFGRGRIVDGHARVALDPKFASLVKLEGYMVFCHPEGDTDGLYVSARDDTGFEVREAKGGRGSFDFAYRIVARRKDITGERLAPIAETDHAPSELQQVASNDELNSWLRRDRGSVEV